MKKIIINEQILRQIISECVKRCIDEARGAIDARMGKLAELIWETVQETIKKEEDKFIIDAETINQYQNYFKATKPIEVVIFYNEDKYSDEYSEAALNNNQDKYVLKINTFVIGNEIEPIPAIMHELTHLVNYEKYNVKGLYLTTNQWLNDWYYLYRDTEMNARISEFSYYLKSKKDKNEPINKSIFSDEYEKILFLKLMERLLIEIQYDKFWDIEDSMIYILYRTNQLVPISNKVALTEKNFQKIAIKIYSWFKKKYDIFYKKACKVLADYL